ncbi:unnamed protein product [Zymoseptoria tritici ST99CH_1A5]|uniref:Uncharacterized protein n=3 Tax=Zymoseptoria tritici TaxID=1047171 RepID=A0A1X7S5S3_ZYMT9|nr:unnamed protein product [Zymoseptoria tritici ST99CH_3D7]SMR59015.1 unnamed protein product [Zymoseptoria tritici ST99CH_1E4]SMR62856.1 unnamed protein product [Zymoseptoria tritici ST99CH_3D1]SMY28226.1 unnamed protein product [Zymoseptoria tritici ST99CH_1A5]
MQFSRTLVAAYLFGSALAGFEIKEAPANSKAGGSGSAKLLMARGQQATCSDGGQCQKYTKVLDGDNPCLIKSRYSKECHGGLCWFINRDPWAYLSCTYPDFQLDDACYRGNPGDDSYWARGVRNCDSTPGNGNAGCSAEDDPCKQDG